MADELSGFPMLIGMFAILVLFIGKGGSRKETEYGARRAPVSRACEKSEFREEQYGRIQKLYKNGGQSLRCLFSMEKCR